MQFRNFSVLFLCLLPSLAIANMGPGADGFFLALINSYFLGFIFAVQLLLLPFKFFSTPLKRNLAIGINGISFLFTFFGAIRFYSQQTEWDTIWLFFPFMFFCHLIAVAIPYVQFRVLSTPKHD